MKTDIHEVDTIYGLYPCETSIAMIDKAIKENKNLLLAFCSCDLSDRAHKKWIGDYWADDVCLDYKEKYEQDFEVKIWPKEFKRKTPILIRRKQID